MTGLAFRSPLRDDANTGRVALVTGGGTGIGRATARLLAESGASVAICGRRPEPLERARAEIEAAGGACLAVGADVREGGEVERVVAAAVERFGAVDVLVNNAGGQFAAPAEEISDKGWRAVHRLNVDAVWALTREVATRSMIAGGGGLVVFVGFSPRRGIPGYAHAAAARAAAGSLATSLALEWSRHGIRSVAVVPGTIDTEGLAGYGAEKVEDWKRSVPLGRLGRPEEVGALIAFLASAGGAYVTGATILVDGGADAWGLGEPPPPPGEAPGGWGRGRPPAAPGRGAGRAGRAVSAAPATAAGRDLRALFSPASVAVVGASDDPAKWGNWLARGALRGVNRRAVHLVNRRGGEVLGRPAHRSLAELPEAPELVVLAVPPATLEPCVDDALAAGVRAIVAITAGADAGGPGDAALAARVRAAGAVLLGPNCLGVYDAGAELELVAADLPAGPIGLVTQSGNLGLDLALRAAEAGLGFSRFVSLGNQADLAATEFVADLAAHPATELIAGYVEDFRDGRAFAAAARAAREAGKRVLLMAIEHTEA